ncbi:MAG: hypothetical protein WC506_03855 [Candidatus Micrarchaeia archaeon]
MVEKINFDGIIEELSRRERENDAVISHARPIIREIATAIKLVHEGRLEEAGRMAESCMGKAAKLPKTRHNEYLFDPILQELAELYIVLAIAGKKPLPTHESLGMPIQPYLTGLCDAVGEVRRKMLESLKAGNVEEAKYLFDSMSSIYESTIPIRFSSSLLPSFKRKQDVARAQVEQARSELLRHIRP